MGLVKHTSRCVPGTDPFYSRYQRRPTAFQQQNQGWNPHKAAQEWGLHSLLKGAQQSPWQLWQTAWKALTGPVQRRGGRGSHCWDLSWTRSWIHISRPFHTGPGLGKRFCWLGKYCQFHQKCSKLVYLFICFFFFIFCYSISFICFLLSLISSFSPLYSHFSQFLSVFCCFISF